MKYRAIRPPKTYNKIDRIADTGTPCKGLMFLVSISEDVYLELMERRRRIESISTTINRELRHSRHWDREWDTRNQRIRDHQDILLEPRIYTSEVFRAKHPDTRSYASCNLRKRVQRGKYAREIDKLKFEKCYTLAEIMEEWECKETKENKVSSANPDKNYTTKEDT